jgi:Zn-dependent protease with chaperone function
VSRIGPDQHLDCAIDMEHPLKILYKKQGEGGGSASAGSPKAKSVKAYWRYTAAGWIGMRHVITQSVLRLGRYAMLPVVAIALALFIAWLEATDHYLKAALAVSPVVLSIVTAALAVALGLLLPMRRKNTAPALDERAAPGLWTIWNEYDRTFPQARRTLLIDTELNASIGEHRGYWGLFHRRITMTVGLPLLMLLDERALRAVIAHEVAHAKLQHTTGGANLHEFIAAAENVFDFADPERTITGRIAYLLLHRLLAWLHKEYHILYRQNELAADRAAAECVGCDDMARALLLVEASDVRVKEIVLAPLEKELLGAIEAPVPPLQRILAQLDTIRAPEPMQAAATVSMTSAEDPDASHPHLRERLANLGFSESPEIDTVRTSAADSVLSRAAFMDLLARFDNEWRRRANQQVSIY